MPITTALIFFTLGFFEANAARICPVSVSASSSLPETEGVVYDVANIKDAKASTVWVENEDGSGLGSWVKLELGDTYQVSHITLWNGNWYSWDFWNRHNRAKEIQVEFSDGTTKKFELKDEKIPETITFPAVATSSIKIQIKSVYAGTTFPDSCFSEIALYDDKPEPFEMPASTTDSGHLPEDGDGNYLVSNTYDHLIDTMWCENKSNDGTGAWVEYKFDSPRTISKMTLRNGNAFSMSWWMKANRATSGVLKFSDGSSEQVTIRDVMLPQSITFSPRTVTSVRFTIDGVKAGSEYNDLCFSELVFSK